MVLLFVAIALVTVGGIYFFCKYRPKSCRHERAYWVKSGAKTQTPKAHHEQNRIYTIKKDSRWCPDCGTWLDLKEP